MASASTVASRRSRDRFTDERELVGARRLQRQRGDRARGLERAVQDRGRLVTFERRAGSPTTYRNESQRFAESLPRNQVSMHVAVAGERADRIALLRADPEALGEREGADPPVADRLAALRRCGRTARGREPGRRPPPRSRARSRPARARSGSRSRSPRPRSAPRTRGPLGLTDRRLRHRAHVVGVGDDRRCAGGVGGGDHPLHQPDAPRSAAAGRSRRCRAPARPVRR